MKEKRIGRYDRCKRKESAEDKSFGKNKRMTAFGGRILSSLLSGFVAGNCLDLCFSFSHEIEWLPARVMLWLCLSILSAALLEAVEVILQQFAGNSCSFSENTCILRNECQKNAGPNENREKTSGNVVAFSRAGSHARAGRRLKNVC